MPIVELPFDAQLTVTLPSSNGSSPLPDHDLGRLVALALAADWTLTDTQESSARVTHLDTADWRLRRQGIDLMWMPATRQLIAARSGATPLIETTGAISWPARISALPDGPVRDLLAGPVAIRALIPYATTRADSSEFAVLNDDRKTVARVRCWDLSITSPMRRRLPARIGWERLRGYDDEADRIERSLTASAGLTRAAGNWVEVLRETPGIGPAETQRFGMQRDQAADLAVADALLAYLTTLEESVDGIVADLDTEFLHDFRVAVRRSRSVLKLLGDVLPDGVADRAADEFRWLGDATTPTRDLDVYLLDFDALAASVSRPPDLQPFADHLRRRRARAHRSLVRVLRSARFADLCRSWRGDLGTIISASAHSQQTAAKLADERLHRTYRKVTKRARAITAESPAEQIHALRKAGKEMRYLLDVFKPLCDAKAYRLVVSDFKQLQDVLGDFQDGEVQAAALHGFAAEMLAGRSADADVILAMGELAGRFDARQRAARDALTAHHAEYLGPQAAAHVDRLIKPARRTEKHA